MMGTPIKDIEHRARQAVQFDKLQEIDDTITWQLIVVSGHGGVKWQRRDMYRERLLVSHLLTE